MTRRRKKRETIAGWSAGGRVSLALLLVAAVCLSYASWFLIVGSSIDTRIARFQDRMEFGDTRSGAIVVHDAYLLTGVSCALLAVACLVAAFGLWFCASWARRLAMGAGVLFASWFALGSLGALLSGHFTANVVVINAAGLAAACGLLFALRAHEHWSRPRRA